LAACDGGADAGAGFAAAGTGAAPAEAVCTGAGTEGVAEAARTGAACCFGLGLAAKSVLALRATTFSGADGAASAFEPLNQLPISPAIVVGCEAGASPCFGCGAARGIGTLATTTDSLVVTAGSGRAGASALGAGGVTVAVRGNAPGAFATRGSAPGATALLAV
jgi:hypothetical protein